MKNIHVDAAVPRPEDCLSGGGEMGALMRSIDWSSTVFGPVGRWPQSLRTAVSIMLESRFAMVIAWGPEFRFFYNDRYRPILGSTKHPAALARAAAEIFPEVWSVIGPEFERVRRGEAFAIDDWLLPLDRNGYLENCWFTLSYSPIRDESGGVGGLLAVVAETTGRVEGERRLATLRNLARRAAEATTAEAACADAAAVLEQNPTDVPFALIYLLEDDGSRARRVARAGIPADHPAAAGLIDLGAGEATHTWPLAQVIGAREAAILEDLPARFGPLPGGSCPEHTHTAVLLPLVRPGQERPYGILVAGLSPRRALDDAYRGFFELAADHLATAISNAHSLEQARSRAEALAEIDRAKTAFFSNVSHEFRTPLTLLLGPTQDALASPDQALRGEALESVHRNALRLLKLVNALLDFSRLEAGRLEAVYEPVDLSALTRDLASGFRSAVERAGLAFRFASDEIAQPAFVDRGLWEKIVLNLLSNAFKFTFQGAISVTLRQTPGHYELAVADTGVGIPENELPHVFERFRRVEGARARTHEGSGIGLALVQELARMHGGEASVTSVPGQGSTFTVSIPRGSAHLPADRIRAAQDVPSTSPATRAFVEEALRWVDHDEAGAEAPPGASRILVADDNADMRAYLGRILGARWAVETHADGGAALAAARARPPDLVLSDVMMPGLDGFGLLRALRADESTRHVPVVLLSARAGEEARIEGLERGADDYLVKPFSARELVARIGSQLTLSAARREAELQRQQMDHLRAEAESASRAKDEFLAMLSHELRNPLSPILTALQLMRLREGAEAVERERVIIERQVRHLTRLVDDLLDVSRVAQGKIELRRHPQELAEVVAKGVELASPLFEERHHELILTVPPTGLLIDADEQRLTQVVANLLTNAAKYTDLRGRIDVAAYPEGEEVVLTVRDNGIGMPAHLVPDVFDLFVQGPRAFDRSHGGLGLGLAIVRSLVTLHGGSVAAASEGAGRGSRFTVRLPLSKAARPGAAGSEGSLARPDRSPARGTRVLVVDDNPDAAEALAEALRIGGYDVRTANDGVQALAIAASFRPDVALLDLGLPVMDGYELGERLRQAPETRGASLVALTGYGHAAHRERSRATGFDEHLVKPVDIATVHEVLRRLEASKPGRASS